MDRSKQVDGHGLEASLIQIINSHNSSSLNLRQSTEKAKKDAIRSATRVSELLVDSVNKEVQEAFVMQKRIEMEIRALAASILQFGKQTDQWLAASHSINTAIKEIGDFENWMKTMEFDCKSINAAICNIHQE
ncbi:Biogenesis of lysosome-related organelles complex 1 subunit 1 [Capsicum baccatum]|uniref:Biogenesis of lysosome-related organelles complex 1 subunit 1 n=1 Tax=Capsicum baccatum TaxID=33114 RepID=A0A2G2VPV1_CAPBA|nr:Biogenesis of lysosome-related organelles complex 1 subunit 1 [Capsicum annuum]KAF3618495.1 Biogenesis of lysosome-related organelles complex 1 subunit 1 [Capsicum annuum]PHT35007.1 Biogenesis of lysosome-related organelles complex 1 subunit 1 [Capsicum baccatum]